MLQGYLDNVMTPFLECVSQQAKAQLCTFQKREWFHILLHMSKQSCLIQSPNLTKENMIINKFADKN